jgi:hypothetical protein
MTMLKRLFYEENGQGMVEYGLIIAPYSMENAAPLAPRRAPIAPRSFASPAPIHPREKGINRMPTPTIIPRHDLPSP